MTKTKRMGRPPLPKEERHDHRLFAAVTRAETVAVRDAAGRRGVTVSEYIRHLIAADLAETEAA